jgi:hypothetical protein
MHAIMFDFHRLLEANVVAVPWNEAQLIPPKIPANISHTFINTSFIMTMYNRKLDTQQLNNMFFSMSCFM